MGATMKVMVWLALLAAIGLWGCEETIVRDLDEQLDKPVEGAFSETYPAAAWMREQPLGDRVYFEARDLDGRRIGYWFPATNYGYRSDIEGLLAISDAGQVQGFAVTAHSETLFYWLLISPQWFEAFAGLDAARVDAAAGDFGPYPIDAVSGATVSSQAVIQDVWDGLETFEQVQ